MSDRQPLTAHNLDRLTESMTELADQVEVLRDVLDEIRSDLQWAVQNDRLVTIPVRCVEQTTIKRMAAEPTSAEWGSRLETHVLQMPTEDGMQQIATTVESIIDEVLTATTGLAWVGDQVREQTDRLEETILAADDDSNPMEVPPQKHECEINTVDQPANAVPLQVQSPVTDKPPAEKRAGRSDDATSPRPPGRLF